MPTDKGALSYYSAEFGPKIGYKQKACCQKTGFFIDLSVERLFFEIGTLGSGVADNFLENSLLIVGQKSFSITDNYQIVTRPSKRYIETADITAKSSFAFLIRANQTNNNHFPLRSLESIDRIDHVIH